jgi:hypothetical protein
LIAMSMNSLRLARRGLLLALPFFPALVAAQQIEVASLGSSGVPGNSTSAGCSMSADGRFIAFRSDASNLVPNDTNGRADVFVRDLVAGTTTRVNVSSAGQEANDEAYDFGISSDGNRVVFLSRATNLAPGAVGTKQIYVRDVQAGSTTLVSVDASGAPFAAECLKGRISGDGRHVVFFMGPPTLGLQVPTPAQYVRDLTAQTTTLLAAYEINGAARVQYEDPRLSQDGRWVAFTRRVTFSPAGAGTEERRVVVIDRDSDVDGILDEAGTLRRVVVELPPGATLAQLYAFSRTGRFIALTDFQSLWLHDRDLDADGIFDEAQATSDAFVASPVSYGYGSVFDAQTSQISDDGRFVAFLSANLQPPSQPVAVVRDMLTGTTVIQSFNDVSGSTAAALSHPALSFDGSWIATSIGPGLIPADTNNALDVYRFPRRDAYCAPWSGYGSAGSNSADLLGADIRFAGSVRISDDDFTLISRYVPNTTGQFYYGPAQVSLPFGDGTRLVGPGSLGVFRLPVVQATGNIASFRLHFGVPPASSGPGQITAGSQWNFQYVFRDPTFGSFGFNTSPALSVTFCP